MKAKQLVTACCLTAIILFGCEKGNGLLTRKEAPPPDFFNAQLQGPVLVVTPENPFGSLSVTRVGLTVADVTKGYNDIGAAWSKLSDSQWMLSMEQLDKVTQRTNSARLVFERLTANGDVQFTRFVINGEEQNHTAIGDYIIAAKKMSSSSAASQAAVEQVEKQR